nr:immunoglobulin heavy chain junction region [Macaca mulatta]MOV86684.1 immunoglobulin heavy chain junction region [Macaca mulatta]MOV86772.1 immunoglobulin heavy chain junction region [Macaca mulatta]MOV86985.1 immunoglobulin heavy chain junction region [Macaca mulatta]MOV87126.1 immunoglobulin heavy chain junction region [Macaca mulatta]
CAKDGDYGLPGYFEFW